MDRRKNTADAVNIADDDGATPLLIAVANRQWGLARMLLEAGADMNLPCLSSSPFLSDSGEADGDWPLLVEDDESLPMPAMLVTAAELMPRRLRPHFFFYFY